MATLSFFIVANHGVSVNITVNDGQTPLRVVASNVHLEVLRDLLSMAVLCILQGIVI
jgi:ankyrin repeat protein